jgi:LPXTG-motif cell wall-anchored protein
MRRIAAIVVIGAVVGLGAMLSPAGAQTSTDVCTYNVSPTIFGPNGGTVTVQGVAPGDSTVRVFADGELIATVQSDPVTGNFSVSFFIARSVEITVSIDDYPATGCGIVGQGVIRGPGARGSGAAGSLARTGSSGTGDIVMVALALIAAGAVLLVATRRKDTIRGRNGDA